MFRLFNFPTLSPTLPHHRGRENKNRAPELAILATLRK